MSDECDKCREHNLECVCQLEHKCPEPIRSWGGKFRLSLDDNPHIRNELIEETREVLKKADELLKKLKVKK
jgi:hypothetical protein